MLEGEIAMADTRTAQAMERSLWAIERLLPEGIKGYGWSLG